MYVYSMYFCGVHSVFCVKSSCEIHLHHRAIENLYETDM